MAILEGGHIVPPPPHSSYIQKPRAIRVTEILGLLFYVLGVDCLRRDLRLLASNLAGMC